MNSSCAPNINIDIDNHYTCFTKDELLSIVYAFNNYIIKEDKNIENEIITLSGNEMQKELWEKIYKALKPICSYEECWKDLHFIDKIKDKKLKEKIRFFTFKPKFYNHGDKNGRLDTNDINNVMNQYDLKYKHFHYLGTFPCDFYLYKKINFKKLQIYKYIGIVCNLDTSDKPGSHWTSLFIDNVKRKIYYFDSTGYKPNKYIKNFIKMYLKSCSPYTNKFLVYVNKHKHQIESNECGVYAIYFLVKKLENCFNNDKHIPHEKMSNYRKQIFIN